MRIGFACIYVHPERATFPKAKQKEIESLTKITSTTISWLHNNPDQVDEKLWSVIKTNCASFYNLVHLVSELPESLRMVRLGSNFASAYTHPDFKHWYKQPEVVSYLKTHLAKVGELARRKNVKLSMHPSQFTTLAANAPHKIQNSIDELEYHGDLIRYMGYGKRKLDFKLNIHLNGQGIDGDKHKTFREAFSRLSKTVQNCLTLENDEFSSGIDDVLQHKDLVGIVLDIHHHWIRTGEYIQPNDPRIQDIKESWHGQRPTLHYSCSKELYLNSSMPTAKIFQKYTKRELAQHSDRFPNHKINFWALGFLQDFDIMCEAKLKNLAAVDLYLCSQKQHITSKTSYKW